MSITLLRETLEDLPKHLTDQILGYAESVRRELPEIFTDVGRQYDPILGDQLVFMAGIRKLYSIVASSFWTLENASQLLSQSGVDEIKAGSTDYSHGGTIYRNLREVLTALESEAGRVQISAYLHASPATILRMLLEDEH